MQAVPAVILRNKILGALLKHARLRAGRLPEDFAAAFDRPVEDVLAWESGQRGITLSELEVWAYLCGVPVSFFWDENALPSERSIEEPVEPLMAIRRKMQGVLLRQSRLIAGLSLEDAARIVGVSPDYFDSCENGTDELTVAQLELAADVFELPVAAFWDEQLFPVSDEERRMRDAQRLAELPDDLREFVLKPSNTLYLRIAVELSGLSADTLRRIAETILDITF
jgi:transcriptional regulator with XRE-family HTH domain